MTDKSNETIEPPGPRDRHKPISLSTGKAFFSGVLVTLLVVLPVLLIVYVSPGGFVWGATWLLAIVLILAGLLFSVAHFRQEAILGYLFSGARGRIEDAVQSLTDLAEKRDGTASKKAFGDIASYVGWVLFKIFMTSTLFAVSAFLAVLIQAALIANQNELIKGQREVSEFALRSSLTELTVGFLTDIQSEGDDAIAESLSRLGSPTNDDLERLQWIASNSVSGSWDQLGVGTPAFEKEHTPLSKSDDVLLSRIAEVERLSSISNGRPPDWPTDLDLESFANREEPVYLKPSGYRRLVSYCDILSGAQKSVEYRTAKADFLIGIARMDLNFAPLRGGGADFTSCDFGSRVVSSMQLWNLDLRNSSFKGATLENVSFSKCDLRGVDFSECNFKNCGFEESLLPASGFFSGSNLDSRMTFVGALVHESCQATNYESSVRFADNKGKLEVVDDDMLKVNVSNDNGEITGRTIRSVRPFEVGFTRRLAWDDISPAKALFGVQTTDNSQKAWTGFDRVCRADEATVTRFVTIASKNGEEITLEFPTPTHVVIEWFSLGSAHPDEMPEGFELDVIQAELDRRLLFFIRSCGRSCKKITVENAVPSSVLNRETIEAIRKDKPWLEIELTLPRHRYFRREDDKKDD